MDDIVEGNGKIEYGKLVQKVTDHLRESDRRIIDIDNHTKDIKKLTQDVTRLNLRYDNGGGCQYSKSLEDRLRKVEDFKNSLSAKAYFVLGILIFCSTIFTTVVSQLLIHHFKWQ